MHLLLHGENHSHSRDKLEQLKGEHKGETLVLEGNLLNAENLAVSLSGESLFASSHILVVENGAQVVTGLAIPTAYWDKADVIFWEAKKLAGSVVTKLTGIIPDLVIEEFKTATVVFQFVEAIRPKNANETLMLFRQYLEVDPPEVIMTMLVRQVRFLLLARQGGRDRGPEDWEKLAPWQRAKIEKQAKLFTVDQLVKLYQDLLLVDFETKAGLSPVTLQTRLELLLLGI